MALDNFFLPPVDSYIEAHISLNNFNFYDSNLPYTMPDSALTQNIQIQHNGAPLQREVSRSLSLSTSPQDTFHPQRRMSTNVEGTSPGLRRTTTQGAPKQLKPFREQDIKILLLENVNQTGKDILTGQGYQVESLKSSLPEDQLIEKIKYAFSAIYLHLYALAH